MTILPLDPAANQNPAALRGFLAQCQKQAAAAGRGQLVSISLAVDALDPLAVLESIFEPKERHFYVERPAEAVAVAGAEAVLAFAAEGPGRFAACRQFVDETLENTVAVGDLSLPFSGPLFFSAFGFLDRIEPGEPFEAAGVFVPRWQVALREGRTVAVANLLVDAGTPVDALAEKVWRAHSKFRAFDYTAPEFADPAAREAAVREVGPAGAYAAAVRTALSGIAEGLFEKIVLARAKDLVARETLNPLRVLNGLRQRFGDCYAFSVANGRGQSFIGASPERLLRVRDGQLLTEAMAGSARRGGTASEDAAVAAALQRDDKELREHALVLDEIVRRLEALGLRPEYPDRPGVRRYANLHHLHTPVRAALREGVRAMDAVAALHPTPAVGGAPRDAAVPRIRELEDFPRGLYAGALGWMDVRGNAEFFVGLRSALIDGNRARLYAGAGIVLGSSPENETAETELKFRAMQEALMS
jgi:menaquinone-specific isochorismate synthase